MIAEELYTDIHRENAGVSEQLEQQSYEWEMERLNCACTASEFEKVIQEDKWECIYELTDKSIEEKLRPDWRLILEYLESLKFGVDKKAIIEACKLNSDSAIKTLVKKELIKETKRKVPYKVTNQSYFNSRLYGHLTGVPPKSPDTEAIRHGNQYEPMARDRYVKHRQKTEAFFHVEETGFHHHPNCEDIGCSPDGLTSDNGLIEIKCPFNGENHMEYIRAIEAHKRDKTQDKYQGVPRKYYAQVQGTLWITGKDYCDFITFDPRFDGPYSLVFVRVTPDKDYIERLANCVFQFVNILKEEKRLLGIS